MIDPIAVEPLDGFRIRLKYADGVSGVVDLSDMAGKGVFERWNEPGYFSRVYVTSHKSIAWDDDLELCADSLYIEITGKTLGEMYPETDPKVAVRDA